MALKTSSMLELGATIPKFELINVLNNELFSSVTLQNGRPTLLMVICNHCPYVIHYHEEIQRLALDFMGQLDLIAISSNDVGHYPQDGPLAMKKLFNALELNFPYLYDESQDLSRALEAQCTPEYYLYDKSDLLVYRGRLDDSSPGNGILVSGEDLRGALDALLTNQSVCNVQMPSVGCSIKWK